MMDYSAIKKKAIADQDRVIKEAVSYLQSNSDVVISGAAGTGKTTITKKILGQLAKPDDEILICALSHQALGVARNFMSGSPFKYNTATNASAIHAVKKTLPDGRKVFLPKDRFKIVKGKRIRIKPPIETAKYIIFDECSQVCDRTLYVLDALRRPDSKVIFLGDICQLPPINRTEGEKFSRVFNKHMFELKHPFRYEGYIAECASYLRSHILNGIYDKEYDPYCWRKFIDTNKEFDILNDHKIFDKRMLQSFDKDLFFTKYIAYNGWAYQKKGKWIRNKIKPNNFDFEVGDDIISKSNYYKNNILLIQNGYQGIIKGKRLMRVALIWVKNAGKPQFYKIHTKKYTNEDSLKKYYAQLLNVYADDIKIEELKYWSHDIDEQKFIPTSAYNPHQLEAALNKLEERDSIHPSSDYDHNWEAHSELEEFFCDIQYAYALTSHTAQGSTYKDVFVSIRNIFAQTKISDLEKLQSLYVAMTRASNNVLGLY